MSAQVTIYNNDPTNVTVTVVNGDPPADQSAQVAQLTADLAALQTKYDSYVAAVQAEAQQLKAADAAKVDGQSILDIPV